jgi:hypothetical protein
VVMEVVEVEDVVEEGGVKRLNCTLVTNGA